MSETILEYLVIEEMVRVDLIKEVNDHINAGWGPIGGVSANVMWTNEGHVSEVLRCQALVRKTSKPGTA